MKRVIFILMTGLLFTHFNAVADDVVIDENGNVETGVSSPSGGGNLDVTGASGEHAIFGSASGTGASGVRGENADTSNYGMLGHYTYGVYGNSSDSYGVFGASSNSYGVFGSSTNSYGIYGYSTNSYAGLFNGNTKIIGNLEVAGGSILSGETDPLFSAWDKSTGISISESQITDLNHFTTLDETDPKVGTVSLNYVPKWDGSSLVTGSVFDNGNVGIGTAAPGHKLEILSSGYQLLKLATSNPNSTVRFTGTATGIGGFFIDANGGNNYLAMMTGSVEKMRINSAGNVGIGTQYPAEKLTVAGTIESTSGGIKFPDATVQTSASPTYVRTVVVSPVPGDALAGGTALLNALAGITDASATNPYLLKIEPGVYDLGNNGLTMQPYVDIEGSGENVTTITSTHSSNTAYADSATVLGADNAEIRFLTVENQGGNNVSVAIYNTSFVSPDLTNITASASGGVTTNFGIFNDSASSAMIHVAVTASGGSSLNVGIYNIGYYSSMTDVTAVANGGTDSVAIFNFFSYPVMTDVTATATGGTSNYGLRNINVSYLTIRNSSFRGSTNSIYSETDSGTRVAASMLEGPAGGGAIFTCVGAFDEYYAALDSACQPIP